MINQSATYYQPDYRSCPSGLGYIHKPDGTEILVTDTDCGPANMDEAKQDFKPQYLPTAIEHISTDIWEDPQIFFNILRKHKVQYVIDTEMVYDDNSPLDSHIPLESWIKRLQ